MTDRELLELAARAAGYTDLTVGLDPYKGSYYWARKPDGQACYWDPINDDGDALRLAVRLGFILHLPQANQVYVGVGEPPGQVLEKAQPDPCAAIRRAIVRAAAAIGQSMPDVAKEDDHA